MLYYDFTMVLVRINYDSNIIYLQWNTVKYIVAYKNIF